MLAAASCAKELELNVNNDSDAQGLTLKFSCGDMTTRGTVLGENNENRVDRIDYFIFPYNEDGKVIDESEWVYQDSIVVAAGHEKDLEYETTVETGVLSKIFPDGAESAVIFAVANYNGKEILGDTKTWGGLHGLEVGQTFTKNGGKGFGLRWPRPMQTDNTALFFVMTADSVDVQFNKTGRYAIDAEVPLKRLASKVTVEFTYGNCTETKRDGTVITWVPQYLHEEARVYLSNAICTSTLGGPLQRPLNPDGGSESEPSANRDIFEYAYDFLTNFGGEGQPEKPYYYTYPISMEAGDDNQPYVKLVLPWYGYKYFGEVAEGGSVPAFDPADPNWRFYKQKEVYYKVVLPRETIKEPNCIYEYKVNVNIIGSDKEVKVTGYEYVVKDWSSDKAIDASVATGRYISLDIPKDEYDMYTDEVEIVFVSSGEVIPIVDSIYQLNLSNPTPSKDIFMLKDVVPEEAKVADGLLDTKNVTEEDVKGWVTIPEGTTYIKINHAIDNRLLIDKDGDGDVDDKNPAFDMSPYVFVVRLHLEAAGDDTSFDRVVTITQYPSIYVIADPSNSYAYVKGYTSTYDTGYAYIWDDNRNSGSGSTPSSNWNGNYYLGTVAMRSLENSANKNTNQYSITVTILDPSTNKVSVGSNDYAMTIGDTRGPKTSLSGMSDLGNSYRPSSDDSQRLVAPRLRVASSYGASIRFTYEGAKKRCAAYQENGYPAGRWRLPTLAEIQFMITLSEYGFIPELFSPSTYTRNNGDVHRTGYWSSGGWLYYGGTQTIKSIDLSSRTATYTPRYTGPQSYSNEYGYQIGTNYYFGATRCVYDEWYWGSDPVSDEDRWLGYMTNETN